ncbi:hypothetical protein F2P81_013366 [Scophthalmus maximus]|uniref:Uncharacterized protein n=1 Tax=Scophthalmus maximus TaxID=52904 RepID=A0A6A4SU21_SCOMX|nr:hypothetical protein F2P81_013366 [Scophthalmus maximus]
MIRRRLRVGESAQMYECEAQKQPVTQSCQNKRLVSTDEHNRSYELSCLFDGSEHRARLLENIPNNSTGRFATSKLLLTLEYRSFYDMSHEHKQGERRHDIQSGAISFMLVHRWSEREQEFAK